MLYLVANKIVFRFQNEALRSVSKQWLEDAEKFLLKFQKLSSNCVWSKLKTKKLSWIATSLSPLTKKFTIFTDFHLRSSLFEENSFLYFDLFFLHLFPHNTFFTFQVLPLKGLKKIQNFSRVGFFSSLFHGFWHQHQTQQKKMKKKEEQI